ncbi:hypothetical protein C1646_774113 [Rhizophagus diaphanus]|nr:hypothetical protein C1646_774113 [Rhizophagus diaphanus] [Rhizophagus sp. MUCL 43196]
MSKWYEWYRIHIKKWIFLEASKAKTTMDSHHAQILFSIKRYIQIGGEIQEGSDITSAIKNIAGTSVAHIEPNRIKAGTLKIQKFAKDKVNQPSPQISESTEPKFS